ncbi:MAG: type II toxin-antitoxin system VapB family antitoxin [Spirochaetota bacterium]
MEGVVMKRMTLTIDENLIADAQRLLGASTKRETVERALRIVLNQKKRERALSHCGNIELDLTQEALKELRETQ